MARHYSPGRSWEATAHAMAALLLPGRTLDMASGDGVMAELIGPRASQLDCIDISEKVVEAGRRRTAKMKHVTFHHGDMHALPFADAVYDTVLCLHALTYSEQPAQVLAEATRVLAPGGQLICATLHQHKHSEHVASYGHVNTGFSARKLKALAEKAGLKVQRCEVTSVESRPPHFEVLTLLAHRS
jgi:ArsR family transcriptional regulator